MRAGWLLLVVIVDSIQIEQAFAGNKEESYILDLVNGEGAALGLAPAHVSEATKRGNWKLAGRLVEV